MSTESRELASRLYSVLEGMLYIAVEKHQDRALRDANREEFLDIIDTIEISTKEE